MRPVIALVGRPNVGKSTLFNFLSQTRDALVADFPGLTRDRKYGICRRYDAECILIDTGGISGVDGLLEDHMYAQTQQAVEESDLVLLVVDAKDGLVSQDQMIIDEMRKQNREFILVVNKVDGSDDNVASSEFYSTGTGELYPISATSGRGIKTMMQTLLAPYVEAQNLEEVEENASRIRLAIIGRPNVGKSTLVNALLGEERVVTSPIPGTTRDRIEIPFKAGKRELLLIDTAGVRRKSKVHQAIEKFSVIQTLDALSRAHVAVIVIDIKQGLSDQDSSLMDFALTEGCALVIAINKTDDASADDYQQLKYTLETRFQFLEYVEKIKISALHKVGLKKMLGAAIRAFDSGATDLQTSELNELLERVIDAHPPPLVRGRRIKLRYIHQGGIHPPTFVVHGSQTDSLPASYVRYMENYFRKKLKLVGTPIRFLLRKPENPYAGKRNTLTPRQQRKRERMMKHIKKTK